MKTLPHFSHLYIEREVREHALTKRLMQRFSRASIVPIDHYKEVFNRPRQSWPLQRASRKLIVALRRDNFLYPGVPITPSFGHAHFYYNALILNCVYDCSYCYLQGLYPSANVVVFVNNEDFMHAVRAKLASERPLYLCVSYDTDLLAFEHLIPYASSWLEFAAHTPDLTIELRTKSAAYARIAHCTPSERVILAWTLSPQALAERYEVGTPTLRARLSSIKAALADGWQVRLCFDPILIVPNWRELYREFIALVFSEIPAAKLYDVSLGTFRMNSEYLKQTRSTRLDADILFYPFVNEGKISGYPAPLREEAFELISALVEKHGVRTSCLR